jgi:hypothetical protein
MVRRRTAPARVPRGSAPRPAHARVNLSAKCRRTPCGHPADSGADTTLPGIAYGIKIAYPKQQTAAMFQQFSAATLSRVMMHCSKKNMGPPRGPLSKTTV